MSSTGYILNGVYYRTKDVPSAAKMPRQHTLHKQFLVNEDVNKFKRDLIQPYTLDGKPNPEFIEAYPNEAERYGFVKKKDRN